MRTARLGSLGEVSRLTLGGGGIGQIWGEVTRDEAVATLKAALDAGIDLIDAAPMYRNAQVFIGETFGGSPPAHLRFTTKCQLGTPAPGETAAILEESLASSLAEMRLERVDVFFLHSNIHAEGFAYAFGDSAKDRFSTAWSVYVHEVGPTMQRLKAQGRIAAWGITGIGVPTAVIEAIGQPERPDVVQVIANLMDSPGALKRYAEPARPRAVAAAARAAGCGVMGIRAVQAGALTSAVDRELSPNNPDRLDYERAQPFRALCARWGQDPAYVAHRYALSLPDFDTIVLGVKTRAELAMCVQAEADGAYSAAEMAEIDGLGLAPR
ncbi:MAG: aldo/keto reductase [Phenylobacterium sp.]|uniref:aldo/keto reductase n=1 Tax=Phenylobacterium sp. TaxID=1871053 RepID=UPI001A620107|nr:aldo/keto reductase [Phenylobacterium sp.]MBL8771946.1 aldo/keto reductase [Phenylobacterium sp.]